MKNIYLDTSCIVEFLAGQRKGKEVAELFESIASGKFIGIISNFALIESVKVTIWNAIEGTKGANMGKDPTLKKIRQVYDSFLIEFGKLRQIDNLRFTTITKEELSKSKTLLNDDQFLRERDAMHLSACLENNYELATFDRRLKDSAKRKGVLLYFN